VHFNINPEELNNQEWAQRFQEWVYVNRLNQNAQEAMLEKTFRKVLVEVLNAAFGGTDTKK
jgi:hypothetical protein